MDTNNISQKPVRSHTFWLIFGLFVVSVLLITTAITQNLTNLPTTVFTPPLHPTPTPVAHTTLILDPNPVLTSSGSATIAVNVNTNTNVITGVQLELSFDPKTVQTIIITPNTFFPTPKELIKDINYKTGRLSYAVTIPAGTSGQMGNGTVALLYVKTQLAIGQQTLLTVLPKTLVTQKGILESVLKSSTGTTIISISPAKNATLPK